MLSLVSVVLVKLLQVSKGSTWVQALRAGQRAETDLIALAKLHVTTEHLKALVCELITRVNNPAVGLH